MVLEKETIALKTKDLVMDPVSSELASQGPVPFFSTKRMQDVIDDRLKKIEQSKGSVFVYFSEVTPQRFTTIQKSRDKSAFNQKLRFMYFEANKILIVKIITGDHEEAHLNLTKLIYRASIVMGMRDKECHFHGATTKIKNSGIPSTRVLKEGDSSIINTVTRPAKDAWPSVVIESGDSESLRQLKMDADWWIRSSEGAVRIVICIKMDKKNRRIRILKFVPRVPSNSHNLRTTPSFVAEQVADITLNHSTSNATIQGAPLVLEFEEVFGRPPNPPCEKDIEFDDVKLDEWAKAIWRL